jgi:hypothetical protein
MKKEIIMSLMGYSREDRLDANVYNSCNFALEDGGLGFYLAKEIAPAAYLASVSSFSRSEEGKAMRVWEKVFEAATVWPVADAPDHSLVASFVRNVNRLSGVFQKHNPDLATDSLRDVCDWLLNFTLPRDKGTVQSWLTQAQAKDRLQKLMDEEMEHDKKRKKWFVDLQNIESGLWLRDVPKKGHGFTNAEFRTALRHRLYLPVFGFVLGSRCTCKKRPGLDREGLHLVSGCNSGNKMADTHNAVAWALETKLKWMGYVTQREERGTFLTGNENDHGRSDISIFNPPFGSQNHQKHLLDIRVSSVLEGVKSGNIKVPRDADVNKKLSQAHTAYNQKMNIYNQRAHQSGCGFTPIVFMSTGGVHDESRKKILELVKHASGNVVSIPKRTLYMSTMRACSVALQKGVATAILTRTKAINERILCQATRVDRQARHETA